MSLKIIEAEDVLNTLLPVYRLEESPSAALIKAAAMWSQTVWAAAVQLGPMALSAQQVSHGLKLAASPVFICGVHRSGTTLLRNLLDGHPELAVLPSEGTYFTNLEFKLQALSENEWPTFLGTEWLRRLANPINQPPYWLLGRTCAAGSPYVDFARYLMAWWKILYQREKTQWPHTAVVLAYASCTNTAAALWVDKTPTNERFLNRIWKEMPGAKIIHVVREPVATLISRKEMEPALYIRTVLKDMKLSFRVALTPSYLNDPRFLVVRYEQLCENPTTVTDQIASFLNIGFSESILRPTVAGLPVKANSSSAQQAGPDQILKPHQHLHNEQLPAAELRLLASYIGNLAAKLNYPITKATFLNKLYLRLRYRL